MAEVATGVLHNVGNVLNSVNVGASVISSKIQDLRTNNLSAAVSMLQEHAHNLSNFVENDAKGQRVLPYLENLARHLHSERNQVLEELSSLTTHIDHIKEIVATQQDYAKASTLTESVSISTLVEHALKMSEASLNRHDVAVIREIDDVAEIAVPKHKVVEILVNLIRNAKQAIIAHNGPQREMRIRVKNHATDRIRIEVEDTGVGLSPENLTRVFAHGFTTKRDGHGFGLHAGALAARQMGGSLWAESKGTGLGATFILELPVSAAAMTPEMSMT
jgi:two-component system, NtrC family, sensor kinase